MFGGNASAEGGGDESADDPTSQSGIDVVLDNRLVETGFSKKKDYQKAMKVCRPQSQGRACGMELHLHDLIFDSQ